MGTKKMAKKSDKTEPHPLERQKADRFALLKRQIKPLTAECEKLAKDLKVFFKAHPGVTELGDVLFSVGEQTRLDTDALRADLGQRITQFEKSVPTETLHVRREATAPGQRVAAAASEER